MNTQVFHSVSAPVFARFDHAALLYKANPNATTLLILEQCALGLLDGKPHVKTCSTLK